MRFVLLEHDHPELHWDLMLECGGVLKTWRLASMPSCAGESIPALALGDHRLAYLDYEGPVSGNRGTVKRRAAGAYHVCAGSFDEDLVVLELRADRWQCRATLGRTAEDWQLEVASFDGV
jgi:hypothetical protein